jgi:hypothetical protein
MLFAKMKVAATVVVTVALLTSGGVVGYRSVALGQPGPGTTTTASQSEIDKLKAELKASEDRTAALRKALADRLAAAKKAAAEKKATTTSSTTTGTTTPWGNVRFRDLDRRGRDDIQVLQARVDVKKAELAVAQASLEEVRAKFVRAGRLAAQKAISPEVVEQAQADVKKAEAQLQVKEAELRESMVILQQGRRSHVAGPLPMTGGKAAPARSLEQRVLDLEKKVEALQKELERSRSRGRSSRSSPGNSSSGSSTSSVGTIPR